MLASRADQAIYTDALQSNWQDWSWAVVNLANSSPVYGGNASISVATTNYSALYLHHPPQDSSYFSNLVFYVNGGPAGGQQVIVQATQSQHARTNVVTLAPLPANSWRKETILLTSLGVTNALDFDGFWMQSQSGGGCPIFYVDQISLTAGSGQVTPPVTNALLGIDVALNRHAISPLIYGTAFAGSSSQLTDLNAPIHRSGGNLETRYNWQLEAYNHGGDWYFESLPENNGTPAASADAFVQIGRGAGVDSMITIPMIGWVPKLATPRTRLASFAVSKYGSQNATDPYWSDAGNGMQGSSPIINDPNDANFPTNSGFFFPYFQHLTNRWGVSTNGGVRYYLTDNEASIWHSSHRDVHPIGATMKEMRDKIFEYVAAVKSVDPNALIAGPEEWGWSGYFKSGYDQWSGGNGDRSTNGGWDYLPWLLDQIRQHDLSSGKRSLDYFTVHYYPQNGEFPGDASPAMQALRNRSTRSLWDTNYVDASWISSVVKLIPRIHDWANTYYPGTKIGITEYNWGAESDINGATAQADILGIFGRENLDLATRWTTPDPSTPTYKAMKMYRNYDGAKSTFGDVSALVSGPDPDFVSAFAAVRSSDQALTVMVINKQASSSTTIALSLTNFLPGISAAVWQLTSANSITHLANIPVSGAILSNVVPAQSITLFVVPSGSRPTLGSIGRSVSNTFDLSLNGQIGHKYALESSGNLSNWFVVQTNLLSSSPMLISTAWSNPGAFFRARWVQ